MRLPIDSPMVVVLGRPAIDASAIWRPELQASRSAVRPVALDRRGVFGALVLVPLELMASPQGCCSAPFAAAWSR